MPDQERTKRKHLWLATKQVEELIVKKNGIKYHHTRIYRILHKWGFKLKVPRKVHINTASLEEKEIFKKGRPDTCGQTTTAITR